jgi:imidazolonepropionase-like amidohydrolase
MRKLLAALVACAAVAHAVAQSTQIPAPPQATPIAILHATVHTAAAEGPATIADGFVVFDAGRILAVGSGTPASLPAGTVTYDGTGLHVSPGFVALMTGMGLVETLAVPVTDDRTETGRLRSEVVAATAINPDTDLFPVARAAGVLLSLTVPSGGLVSGRASALRLDGWTPETIAIDPDVGVVVQWPLVEPVEAWWTRTGFEEQRKRIREDLAAIERFFDDGAAYCKRPAALRDGPVDQRFEGLRGLFEGGDPVYVTVGSVGQIESALAWAKRRGVRPILVGGPGVEEAIPLLQAEKVAVIVTGTHRLPGRSYDRHDEPFALPAKLEAAGIPFAIASADEPAHERNLPHHAGTAAAFGLSPEAALRSITRSAAELAGIGDRYGSIAPGKSATLFVSTGDPLEITSDVLLAFIDGRGIDLGSRQTRLLEKYRAKYRQLGAPLPERPARTVPVTPAAQPSP